MSRRSKSSRSRSRKSKLKKIEYPHFLEYKQLETDEFWLDIIDNCSFDILPKFFSFYDDRIIFKSKSISLNVKLTGNHPDDWKNIKNFFLIHGIRSKIDINSNMNKLKSGQIMKVDIQTWKNIKSKKNRQILILRFVNDLFESMKLPEYEILLSIINKAILFKVIKDDDIVLKDGAICEIKSLRFNREENQFYIINLDKIVENFYKQDLENELSMEINSIQFIENSFQKKKKNSAIDDWEKAKEITGKLMFTIKK